MTFPPLLITSGINVEATPFLKMRDAKSRLSAVINGVHQWQSINEHQKIVIVDGTGFDLTCHFSSSDIEILTYRNDQSLVEKYGKGAGEAQDVQYALQNSNFIFDTNHFMKVTGKRWVTNIHQFKKSDIFTEFKCKPIVTNWLDLLYINTAFFSSTRTFYLKNFSDVHYEVDDFKGIALEQAMAQRIKNNKIKGYCYSVIPELRGWDGSGNHSVDIYPDRVKHVFRNFKYRILSGLL